MRVQTCFELQVLVQTCFELQNEGSNSFDSCECETLHSTCILHPFQACIMTFLPYCPTSVAHLSVCTSIHDLISAGFRLSVKLGVIFGNVGCDLPL